MKKLLIIFLFISTICSAKRVYVTVVADGTDISDNILSSYQAGTTVTGDSIMLPYGSYRFDSYVYMDHTKVVHIVGTKGVGKGIPQTYLYRDESLSDSTIEAQNTFFWFYYDDNIAKNVTISYIDFACRRPSITPSDGGSLAASAAIRIRYANGFAVHHCTFKNFGESAIRVDHKNTLAHGLIKYCKFINNAKGYDGLGLGYGVVVYGEGADVSWVASPQFGSNNFIVVEDCYFKGGRHSIAANDASLFVFRRNTVEDCIIGQGIDQHEEGRACEIYGNTVINNYVPIEEFANTAARNAFAPVISGSHYGVQTNDNTTWVSNGTSAGNWTQLTGGNLPIPTFYGCPIRGNSSVFDFCRGAVNIRGGEALIYNNYFRGYWEAIWLKNHNIEPGTYPEDYQIGWASALVYGSSHTGTDAAHGDGDVFEWNNTIVLHDVNDRSVTNHESEVLFQPSRDYHRNTAKPGHVQLGESDLNYLVK